MEFIIDEHTFSPHQKYKDIMDMISNPDLDVSKDTKFQTVYSGYYITAPIEKSFRKYYFEYMQKCRDAVPSFREIMETLYNKTGAVHYSFSSKLLHTLAPENPVLDSQIMWLLGFVIQNAKTYDSKDPAREGKKKEDDKKRIQYYCDAFDAISSEYQRYKDEPFMKDAIDRFDAFCSDFKDISYTKKVDMLLFRLPHDRTVSVLDYLYLTH